MSRWWTKEGESLRKWLMKTARLKKLKAISATELAQMGMCEHLVVFEHRYGKRNTESRRAALMLGLREHDRFYRQGVLATDRKGRRYIATLIFGTGWETRTLRKFAIRFCAQAQLSSVGRGFGDAAPNTRRPRRSAVTARSTR